MGGALSRLYERAPMGMRLGLAPMLAACEAEGHPEGSFRAVHVAGTNGKGSVCAMVESIARAAGMRTGLYTSPHLCRFAERIRIDGQPIDDAVLEAHLVRALRHENLSFFETATLAAFLALRDARVDIGVIEVGLGGRLDATNVLEHPLATAVTRIALDHTQLLGDTLEAIAREKAAIAKPGVELIVGSMTASVVAAITEVARACGATVSVAPTYPAGDVGLAGAHQRGNAAIAYALGRRIGASEEACARGIASVEWPGRLERVGNVLLDAAHNPDGAQALASHLASNDPQTTALIFGALADKAWMEMIDTLAPRAAKRFYVKPTASLGARTATEADDIAARQSGTPCSSVAEALERARATDAALIVVCGSVFVVGEARSRLLGLVRDPPIAL